MPAATRLSLAGSAIVAALLLPGCGGGDSDSTVEMTITGPTTTAAAEQPRPTSKGRPVPGGNLCQSQLGSFVGSLDGLRRRLAVGVTYDQYVAEVRGIRSTYGEIPFERLRVDCLAAVGTPSEKAFNRYIEGANDWGECVSEVGCETATIEPILQRRWRIASRFLSEAREGLGKLGARS
ncbi:MAG TPA: hypothetical protein VFY69_00195 [Solirubrobacterales bacterium]|nr:hypothetical protein [Solirubrobacterales bacterium]